MGGGGVVCIHDKGHIKSKSCESHSVQLEGNCWPECYMVAAYPQGLFINLTKPQPCLLPT